MKKTIFIIIWFILSTKSIFANNNDAGILWWNWTITAEDLRKWEIHTDNIPNIIVWATDYIMWFAWTIALIFIIIWAYQILFGSLSQDKSKWRNTIIMAITWFAVASLAWIIVKMIIDNFS